MSNEELLKIEKRMRGSLDAAALINEVRLAWRCLDELAQTRIDQDKAMDDLRARVKEMEAADVA